MLEEYSVHRCLALRCWAQLRSGDGGIEGGADTEVHVQYTYKCILERVSPKEGGEKGRMDGSGI